MESKKAVHYIYFLFSCYYVHIVTDTIKKQELSLLVVSILLMIEFGHTQIIVPKISIPMSKTICINPW